MKQFSYWLKLTVMLLIGMIIALIVVVMRKVWSDTDIRTVYRDLSDAFTVPGALLILLSGLIFVSNGGAFYGFSFAMLKFFNVFRSNANRNREGYKEYCERKREKRVAGYSYIFFAGVILLIPGIVFLVLYII
ncbi:MAG: DUF3899 domain-containing protein [Clostridia bacterium]|nr:DUF3899 domain-containing protein [Clostridia bacterium]